MMWNGKVCVFIGGEWDIGDAVKKKKKNQVQFQDCVFDHIRFCKLTLKLNIKSHYSFIGSMPKKSSNPGENSSDKVWPYSSCGSNGYEDFILVTEHMSKVF